MLLQYSICMVIDVKENVKYIYFLNPVLRVSFVGRRPYQTQIQGINAT